MRFKLIEISKQGNQEVANYYFYLGKITNIMACKYSWEAKSFCKVYIFGTMHVGHWFASCHMGELAWLPQEPCMANFRIMTPFLRDQWKTSYFRLYFAKYSFFGFPHKVFSFLLAELRGAKLKGCICEVATVCIAHTTTYTIFTSGWHGWMAMHFHGLLDYLIM